MEFRQAILGTETGIAVLEAALGSEDLLLHGILLEGPRRKDLVAGESRQPVRHKQEGGHIEMVAFHKGSRLISTATIGAQFAFRIRLITENTRNHRQFAGSDLILRLVAFLL